MALMTICPICRNPKRLTGGTNMTTLICYQCAAKEKYEQLQDQQRSQMADDLVRGAPPNSRDSDT